MSIWLTADTHFGHANIIKHCYRPFTSVEEMDEYMLDRLNRCVRPGDDLYHLGDFAWGGRWREYRDRINCQRIHLIVGNHDKDKEVKHALRDGIFQSVHEALRLRAEGLKLLLFHYPVEFWRPGYLMLHGHSHGGAPHKVGRKDVGVDVNSFAPVSLGALKELPLPDYRDGRHGDEL